MKRYSIAALVGLALLAVLTTAAVNREPDHAVVVLTGYSPKEQTPTHARIWE